MLAQLQKTSVAERFSLKFQNSYTPFPVYLVSSDLPKYRLENGRTTAAQAQYLAEPEHSSLPRDLFDSDPESDIAQKAQHDILKSMIGESDLRSYFGTNEQGEPIVLSSQGFVINGNRRLCSMREWYDFNSGKYSRYRNVKIIILPAADEKELDWLEGKEQIQKDITAEYSWTAEAIMYRRRLEKKIFSIKELAGLYEKDVEEISELLDLLKFGDLYLTSRRKPAQYSLIDKDKYAFSQLRKYRKKISGLTDRKLFETLAFEIIDEPMGKRAYQSIADLNRYFSNVKAGLAKDPKVREAIKPLSTQRNVSTDLLRPNQSEATTAVIDPEALTKTHELKATVRSIVQNSIEEAEELDKVRKDKKFVQTQVSRALAALESGAQFLEHTPDSETQGLADQLDDIRKLCERIGKQVRAPRV